MRFLAHHKTQRCKTKPERSFFQLMTCSVYACAIKQQMNADIQDASSSSSVDRTAVDISNWHGLGQCARCYTCFLGSIHSWTWLENDLCSLFGVFSSGRAQTTRRCQRVHPSPCAKCGQAGAPNENIVQNHLNIALLNVFQYLNGRYRHIFIP